jgi:hypothetical protein
MTQVGQFLRISAAAGIAIPLGRSLRQGGRCPFNTRFCLPRHSFDATHATYSTSDPEVEETNPPSGKHTLQQLGHPGGATKSS